MSRKAVAEVEAIVRLVESRMEAAAEDFSVNIHAMKIK